MVFKRALSPAACAFFAIAAILTTSVPAQAALVAYSAKFVCGPRTLDSSVVKGQYETTVNIHNPHFIPIQFQKKAVLALPQSANPGPISKFVTEALKPDEALGVNCRDIRVLFSPLAVPAFIEGFLVIYIDENIPIDVVEVHTARHRGTGSTASPGDFDVESIDTRQVNPIRAIPAG